MSYGWRRVWPAMVVLVCCAGLWQLRAASASGSAGTESAEGPVSRPIPSDMIEGFADGHAVAFQYRLSYYCATMPNSDVDPPAAQGNGTPESMDPLEYQAPPCIAGDSGTGSLPIVGPDGLAQADEPKLYGIFPTWYAEASNQARPNFLGGLVDSNNPTTDVETQCTQPGPPATQYKSNDPFSCLMHPSVVRSAYNRTDVNAVASNQPEVSPLGPHSHIIEGDSHPLQWWNVVAVGVNDPSIWPDNDGNCPAGPPRCVTSLAALRTAQKSAFTPASTTVSTATVAATPDIPSNIYFYFSVLPERASSRASAGQISVLPARSTTGMLPKTMSSADAIADAAAHGVHCLLRAAHFR